MKTKKFSVKDACKKELNNKEGLNSHINGSHVRKTRCTNTECDMRSLVLMPTAQIKEHKSKIHGDRGIYCKECPKEFNNEEGLKRDLYQKDNKYKYKIQ